MIQVKKIDHVAIALPDIDQGLERLLALFALQPGARERITDAQGNGTDVCFLHARGAGQPADPSGEVPIELVAPAGNDSLDRFLDRRGTALHHVCFEVEDLVGALATLQAAGVPLVDTRPRPGARGRQVAFIHPKATGGVLFELCQHGPTPMEGRAP